MAEQGPTQARCAFSPLSEVRGLIREYSSELQPIVVFLWRFGRKAELLQGIFVDAALSHRHVAVAFLSLRHFDKLRTTTRP